MSISLLTPTITLFNKRRISSLCKDLLNSCAFLWIDRHSVIAYFKNKNVIIKKYWTWNSKQCQTTLLKTGIILTFTKVPLPPKWKFSLKIFLWNYRSLFTLFNDAIIEFFDRIRNVKVDFMNRTNNFCRHFVCF